MTDQPNTETEIERLQAENLALRQALAYEADVIEAHTVDLKSLGKDRRTRIEWAVARMRHASVEGWDPNQSKYRFSASFENQYEELLAGERSGGRSEGTSLRPEAPAGPDA